MAYRNQRIEKIIERELSTILLFEAKNELLRYVSITNVMVNGDLSVATIWFTVRGDEAEVKATAQALEDAKGFLRTDLSRRLDIRKMPELRFKLDESLAYGNKIDQMLKDLNNK